MKSDLLKKIGICIVKNSMKQQEQKLFEITLIW